MSLVIQRVSAYLRHVSAPDRCRQGCRLDREPQRLCHTAIMLWTFVTDRSEGTSDAKVWSPPSTHGVWHIRRVLRSRKASPTNRAEAPAFRQGRKRAWSSNRLDWLINQPVSCQHNAMIRAETVRMDPVSRGQRELRLMGDRVSGLWNAGNYVCRQSFLRP